MCGFTASQNCSESFFCTCSKLRVLSNKLAERVGAKDSVEFAVKSLQCRSEFLHFHRCEGYRLQ
jgi:hypothetical protein